ncbi:hypothetical protein [Reyranella soli]|uniref:hypothetical protein n=1 Tax=Reyranella soli TaxID=1230389 RepID=UPI0011BE58DD|nr:hypothetical protein [Reyranella soli]
MKRPQRGKVIEVQTSPEMIEAGLQLLRESGALAGHSVAHALLVLRILQKALEIQQSGSGSFRGLARPQKTLDALLQRL